MFKKSRLLTFLLTICLFGLIATSGAYADSCGGVDTSVLSCNEGGAGGVTHIVMIVLDIVSTGVAVAGVVAICIFGYQMATSKGDQDKTTAARRRLFGTIIGLACYAVLFSLLKWLLPGGDFDLTSEGGAISVSISEPLEVGKTIAPTVNLGTSDRKATYSLRSSDPKTANVVGTYVKCLKVGTATITAISDSGASASTTITCIEPVKKDDDSGSDGSGSSDDSDDSDGSGPKGKSESTSWSEYIAKTAEELSWSKGTSKSKYHHNYPLWNTGFKSWKDLNGAKPTQAFMDAYDKVRPAHDFSSSSRLGADCGVFVVTVLRYSGHDSGKNRINYGEADDYYSSSKKWKKVDTAKRGDVCTKHFYNAEGKPTFHTRIYLGNNRIAEANHEGRNFAHIDSGDCKGYEIWRADD